MIKRIVVPGLIIILFIVGSIGAVRPFAAEVAAGSGDLALAIRLDPLDARYPAKFGEGLAKKARAGGGTAAWTAAGNAYAEAVRLDGHNSAYRVELAEVQAHLLRKRGVVPVEELDAYVSNLKRAIAVNPNYYFTNAAAGYYLLLFKARLTESDRNFAIYRMRYALELNPDYANYVFSYLANDLKDYGLLQRVVPRNAAWQARLVDFLRDIDRWKYRQ